MKVLDIAFKDLQRSFRSATALIFMFVVPLLVTGLFYFMFGNMARQGNFNLPRTKVVVVNLDRNGARLQSGSGKVQGGFKARTLSELVVEVLASDKMAELLEVSQAPDAATARAAVDSQQAQVAIIIPAGFSESFGDAYKTSQLEFYQDPTLTIGPGIVRSILSQFMDSLSAIKILVSVSLDTLQPKDYGLIGPIVQQYLDTSATQTDDLSKTLLDVRSPKQEAPQPAQSANPLLGIITPIMGGMMIFYAFYTGTASAESILREEEERTLPRLFTTPTSQSTVLTGKFLSVFLTVLVQVVVLIVVSRLIFGIQWGALPQLAVMTVGVVVCASSFGIFINSLLKNTKQGGLVFGGVLTVTGMLGMIRIFTLNSANTPAMMSVVTLLVPQGWGVRGLLLGINGMPVSDVLLNSLALLVWSAAFFIIGVWRFKRRYA